jgi:hypothetical protein
MIGKMYLLRYDPKYKASLPYYDTAPLIILCDRPKKGKGFYALNVHYLSPLDRAKLLGALAPLETTNRDRKATTKIRMSYSILKAAKKYRRFKPCFKRYLPEHIKSKLVEIPAQYWDIVLMLPTQQFQGASVSQVWAESRKKAK